MVPVLTPHKSWWCQPNSGIPGVLVRLISLYRTLEDGWSRPIDKEVTVRDGCSWWVFGWVGFGPFLSSQDCQLSSCVAGVIVFYGLVHISLENRLNWWIWPNVDMATAYFHIILMNPFPRIICRNRLLKTNYKKLRSSLHLIVLEINKFEN